MKQPDDITRDGGRVSLDPRLRPIRQDLRNFYRTGSVEFVEEMRRRQFLREAGFGRDCHGHAHSGPPVFPMSEFTAMGGSTKGCTRHQGGGDRVIFVDPAILDQLPEAAKWVGARSALVRTSPYEGESED